MPRTKVFLTWSGDRSKEVAKALRSWLPKVIQNLEPWMSDSDIDKGTRWNLEISGQLRQAKIGIICLTPENLGEPWINFEAGALSKLEKSFACTYLLDLAKQDIPYPLAQFQATKAEMEDTRQLLHTINKAQDGDVLTDENLNAVFEKWWPDLNTAISKIPKPASTTKPPQRSTTEVLEEIVSTIRENTHTQSTILAGVNRVLNVIEEERLRTLTERQRSEIVDALLTARGMTSPGFGFGKSAQSPADTLASQGPLVLRHKFDAKSMESEEKK